jgi:DNA-binding CsgD family transcriptional regulator
VASVTYNTQQFSSIGRVLIADAGGCMADLRAGTLRRCLDFADRVLAVEDFRAVRELLLPALGELMHSDLVIYHEVDRRAGEEVAVGWPPDAYRAEYLDAYPQLMTQHPVISYALAGPASARPVRISDWLSRRQWHANPLYRDSYRHLQVDDQLATGVIDRGGSFSGISLGRAGRSYGSEEQDVLALVLPHVRAALRRAETAPVEISALRVAPAVETTVMGGGPGPESLADPRLTAREKQVLGLVARGLTDQQVANRLGVSVRTVGKHMENVHAKLGVTNRQAAVHAARRPLRSTERSTDGRRPGQ